MNILGKISSFIRHFFPLGRALIAAAFSRDHVVQIRRALYSHGCWALLCSVWVWRSNATDFDILFKHPKAVIISVIAQFADITSNRLTLSKLLNLPAEIAVSVILVGHCPRRYGFNVTTYPARVTIMALSGLLRYVCFHPDFPIARLPTSSWCFGKWNAGNPSSKYVDVHRQNGLLPIVLGLIVHKVWASKTEKLTPMRYRWFPLPPHRADYQRGCQERSKGKIMESGLLIFAVVTLHNSIGYLLSFFAAK